MLNNPNYEPNRLFDHVIGVLKLKNDAALAKALGSYPVIISKVRHRRVALTDVLMVQIMSTLNMDIRQLRELAGIEP